MASPFPGMDPFIEDAGYWSEFHVRFINAWADLLADALPERYEMSLGERVYLVENDPDTRKLIYPDLGIEATTLRSRAPPAGSVATLEPVTIPLVIPEGPREAYVEILHRPDRQLVTALELLSPANKEPPGRIEYLAKRRALLYQKVNLVELDLLHGGRRMPTAIPLPPADYYYLVARSEERPDAEVSSWTLRDPLPRLPVPLLEPDPDIFFDLAAVFNTTYERARFGRKLPYKGPLPASLGNEDCQWAAAILAKIA